MRDDSSFGRSVNELYAMLKSMGILTMVQMWISRYRRVDRTPISVGKLVISFLWRYIIWCEHLTHKQTNKQVIGVLQTINSHIKSTNTIATWASSIATRQCWCCAWWTDSRGNSIKRFLLCDCWTIMKERKNEQWYHSNLSKKKVFVFGSVRMFKKFEQGAR